MPKKQIKTVEENIRIQSFLDMISPSVIKLNTDHFICGNI